MDDTPVKWFASIFSHPDLAGSLIIAAKTAVIYVFIVAGLRLLGKRSLGQMSIYDLVLIVVIANAVQNAMVGQDTTLGGGLVAAVTLLILNRIFTWLAVRFPEVRHLAVGEPVLIVSNGQLLEDQMKREGITPEHVMAAMRERGIDKLENVQMAVLELDGAISIVPKESAVHRTQRRFRGLRVS
jgi:uncharacterized membrane protein YcaP (DUF421 family)